MNHHKRNQAFLSNVMTEEERKLLDKINMELARANLHLRLRTVKIHNDGSISTEYVPPIDKWIGEDIRATSIVQEELTKYQSK